MKFMLYSFIFIIAIIQIQSIFINIGKFENSENFSKNLRIDLNKMNSTDISINDNINSKLKEVIILYIQFFFIFSLISFLKVYEEIFKIISVHIETKYNNFIDISNNSECLDIEDKFIYASGQPVIITPAIDPLIEMLFNKKYAKLDRKIELFVDGNWFEPNFDLMANFVEYENSQYMQFIYKGQIYTFPRIEDKKFYGEVELRNIKVSKQQIKLLEKYEAIQFNSSNVNCNFSIKENAKFEEPKYEIHNDYIIIFPVDKDIIEKNRCKIKIKINAYPCKELTIISQIKNGKFKTLYAPSHKYLSNDNTHSLNNSTNMITIPNFRCDILNILFCFCLSGPTIYRPSDESPDSQPGINWLKEEKISKTKFLYERHYISVTRLYITRIVIFLFVSFLFYIFPKCLYTIYSIIGYEKDKIDNYFFMHNFFVSKLLITGVILFSKISYRAAHCINMCLCFSTIIFIGYFISKQLIKLV